MNCNQRNCVKPTEKFNDFYVVVVFLTLVKMINLITFVNKKTEFIYIEKKTSKLSFLIMCLMFAFSIYLQFRLKHRRKKNKKIQKNN